MNASISDGGPPAARMSRSPHVSQPRRRLPTIEMSARGRARAGPQRARRRCRAPPASGDGPRTAALLERLQDQRLLFRAHALELADASVACGGSRSSSVRTRGRGRAAPTVFGPTPCRCSRSRMVGGKLLQQLPVIRTRRSRRARRSSRRGPCRCRECASRSAGGQVGDALAEWAIVSAALRYARILNGFSLLISRRSPISAKTRAMARLSTTRR